MEGTHPLMKAGDLTTLVANTCLFCFLFKRYITKNICKKSPISFSTMTCQLGIHICWFLFPLLSSLCATSLCLPLHLCLRAVNVCIVIFCSAVTVLISAETNIGVHYVLLWWPWVHYNSIDLWLICVCWYQWLWVHYDEQHNLWSGVRYTVLIIM